ncbi:CRISPR-associated protein Cas4 [Bradyrhizobium sp. U87765 SZCCT0131]|uniref:CRISPR-associated protein Cas4 n=1 Tax=unclassified Bradyrhizobium TaxID=2631580 RepID=UPI001BA73DF0|nr:MULTISPECIES: CRISPR-associated protein Cas4 [unclassified Bradyrhizobium]MBR1217949.1 CRISPR-associated protein Cas4 [Bradyrhizobium sp. U87765 SZCCT0131]MBR1261105.1 CRISPR-associated protein Cas4 [Bradyrhizobium sp. U87765 SZCCT0134]MBR1303447.1 CRISPR-associated protein Cas4 [Bradyrhizobium sp. U87765 SZCCT0110]MBR1319053.1 CRISPR-associated protein Cas4 [Bradyrhizobium sp. U87765 SZCCT0109]MBR1347378.1 CRISPR-associated protein Cas4 [Bradyrhizobium sp. U87765 SZCCT0048]
MEDHDDPIPLSALQHAVYCLRQAALIHVERLWEENRFTAEGRVLHDVAHDPAERSRRGVRRVTALPLSCRRLNLAGVADIVEFRSDKAGETPYPVEYKRGKIKLHRADEVQLCAQALCLEEMTGKAVPEGAIFYAETKRRTVVPFDMALRQLTEDTARQIGRVIAAGHTPPPLYRSDRCRACSLIELCRPKAVKQSALEFRLKAVRNAIAHDEPAS